MTITKRIVFISGTRSDFGKIKSLLNVLVECPEIELHLFVTGMHMLKKYGYTYDEIEKCNYPNIYKYVNQNHSDSMDSVLAKTVQGFSDFVKEIEPDMIVVHGDRVEALAGALVGSLNNCLVGHIEGGEVSGTVDGLLRHAISKMCHVHFAANEKARQRLLQLGEQNDNIYVIGSPDIDILNSPGLPDLEIVKQRYEIPYDKYAILLFHPVTSELDQLRKNTRILVDLVGKAKGRNFIAIAPNNDSGSEIIFEEYERLAGFSNVKLYPSMRFEYFLSLLKHAQFIIGNSSAGVREAPYYGVPCINIGTRQMNRSSAESILNVDMDVEALVKAMVDAEGMPRTPVQLFGNGESHKVFLSIVRSPGIWKTDTQKYFNDIDF